MQNEEANRATCSELCTSVFACQQESKDIGKEMYGSDHLRELAEEMVSIMRKAPGVGLAAPQIGVSLKVVTTVQLLYHSENIRRSASH